MFKSKIIIIIITILAIAIAVYFTASKSNLQDKIGYGIGQSAQGALIINTDRSSYSKGDTAYIQITSLDASNNTLCNSNLQLTISNIDIPNSIFNIPVSKSSTCNSNEFNVNNPDYYAYFKPEEDGVYKFTLTNKDDGNTSEVQISVGEIKSDISVFRWGSTRLSSNMSNRYPMIIAISANSDFRGKISDTLPETFSFVWYGNAQIDDDKNTITWNVDLEAGETTELKYEYSPGGNGSVYTIGPISASENGMVTEIGNKWNLILQKQ